MNQANPVVITQVKLKIARYVAEVMQDRDIKLAQLSESSGVSIDDISNILNAGGYKMDHLLAVTQVLRIHLIFEATPSQINLADELLN